MPCVVANPIGGESWNLSGSARSSFGVTRSPPQTGWVSDRDPVATETSIAPTMTKLLPCCLFAAASLLAVGTPARVIAADEARVTVEFQNPEKFTDIKDSITGTDKGRDHYLKLIREVVETEANSLLRPGQKLAVTFTDIDLAGDYLPSMPSNRDIRVIKDIYIPRMKLSYVVTDAAGAVVKEGKETISDLNFMQTMGLNRSDELFYDKAMLRDWLRRTLR